MQFRQFALLFFVALSGAAGLQYVAFDGASATATYSNQAKFAATQALAPGMGYWASGSSNRIVSWTGVLDARRSAAGIKINWAYAPGQIKVLTSADGANFEEASGWKRSARSETSYEENVMFASPQTVKAVTIVMSGPTPSGLFGLNSVMLIAEPGHVMLVSGATSPAGELCFVGGGGFSLTPCLEAIAGGDGAEIFSVNEGGVASLASRKCITLAGGKVSMGRCGTEASFIEVQTNGQMKFSRLGDYCLVGTSVGPCAEAALSADASDKVFMVGVPEMGPGATASARSSAALLLAAQSGLQHTLGKLKSALPKLGGCSVAAAFLNLKVALSGLAKKAGRSSTASTSIDPEATAIAAITPQLNVDFAGVTALIEDAKATLSAAAAKME